MEDKNLYKEDLISVSSIKHIFISFFKSVFRIIGFIVSVINRSKLLFITMPIISIALGCVYYFLSPTVYEQSMLVKFNELTNKTYYEIFAQLNDLAQSKSYQSLARELTVSEDLAKQIESIKLENVNGVPLKTDTSKNIDNPVKITVKTFKNTSLKELESALILKINNNNYLERLKEQQKKLNLLKIDFIDSELSKLDSLKDEYTRSLNSGRLSTNIYNNAFNPADVFVQSSELVTEKQLLLKWLNDEYYPMNLIDGFKTIALPKSLSLAKCIFIALSIAVVFSFMFAFIIEIKLLVERDISNQPF